MTQPPAEASVIKAYWQPGCTSCLRMKEFLSKHGVPFVSVNVLEDKDAFAELETLGIRSVPIVRRGKDWANGQVLRDVARVAGIAWGGAPVLPASELAARLIEIQSTAQRLFAQIPDDKLACTLPHPLDPWGLFLASRPTWKLSLVWGAFRPIAKGEAGLGLDAQREAALRHLAHHAGELIGEFCEVESRNRSDRLLSPPPRRLRQP